MSRKQLNRWLRALEIAKAMFYFEGYDDRYLVEIELFLKEQFKKTNGKEVIACSEPTTTTSGS